jgi:hypothetical protein
MTRTTDEAIARQGRVSALVIAGSVGVWIIAQAAASALGLTHRHLLLVDFATLAALFWAMVNVYQMWRKRRATKSRH